MKTLNVTSELMLFLPHFIDQSKSLGQPRFKGKKIDFPSSWGESVTILATDHSPLDSFQFL